MPLILVVDDSEDNRFILRRMLEIGGFSVVTAIDGQDALGQVATLRPALIMLDLAMPQVDGWTLAAELRKRADLRETPLLAITGHVMRDELIRALDAGCDDYLSKPIDYETLLLKVRALIKT